MSEPNREDLPPRLARFVDGFDRLLAQTQAEPELVARGGALLRELVAHDDWLPPSAAEPDPSYYRQYLLYRDPQARYSVVSFVWGPGQSTPIHDHTVWGLTSLLRGAELAQAYERDAEGRLRAHGAPERLEPGAVAAVSPALGDIHQVENAYRDRVSIGIHVYGADIGAVERSVYTADGARKPFRSGYANVQ